MWTTVSFGPLISPDRPSRNAPRHARRADGGLRVRFFAARSEVWATGGQEATAGERRRVFDVTAYPGAASAHVPEAELKGLSAGAPRRSRGRLDSRCVGRDGALTLRQ
jgi:hypothetical protein